MIDISELLAITSIDDHALALCKEAAGSFEALARNPKFYTLDKNVFKIIIDNVEIMKPQTAKIVVSLAYQYYQKSILEIIEKIHVGGIGSKTARIILEPLLSIPLLRELINNRFEEENEEEECTIGLDYEFYYNKTKEEAEKLRKDLEDVSRNNKKAVERIIRKYRFGDRKDRAMDEIQNNHNNNNSEIISILKEAITFCNVDEVETLSPFVDLNCYYEIRYPTILSYAIEYSSVEVIKTLIKNGASISNAGDQILFLALQNSPKVMEFLVNQPGINVNARNSKGNTPLFDAQKLHKPQMACILRKSGGKRFDKLKG